MCTYFSCVTLYKMSESINGIQGKGPKWAKIWIFFACTEVRGYFYHSTCSKITLMNDFFERWLTVWTEGAASPSSQPSILNRIKFNILLFFLKNCLLHHGLKQRRDSFFKIWIGLIRRRFKTFTRARSKFILNIIL